MKKSMVALTIGLAIGCGFVNQSKAEEVSQMYPVAVSLAAPIQFPCAASDIYGFRFGGFFGAHHNMCGLDLGITELSTGTLTGLQLSAFSWTEGKVAGAQLGVLANVVRTDATAFQLGLVNAVWGESRGVQFGALNYNSEYTGIQLGALVNMNESTFAGLEIAPVNANQNEYFGAAFGLVNYGQKFSGFDLGIVNVAYDVTGVQLGLFNACDTMHGVQIGLVNMICNSKLPIMVLANASF